MEPSKAAMKAALRVLTALSERQEPDQADVDELHWYAPSGRERPLDEVVCDAIQRALQDRERTRKATKARLREKVLAMGSGGSTRAAARTATLSYEERDREIRRLIQDYGKRRREYISLTAKLKRLGNALHQAAANIGAIPAGDLGASIQASEDVLQSVAGEVDLGSIRQLITEHVRLTRQLISDQQALRDHGIEP
jgi:hypothetical protein